VACGALLPDAPLPASPAPEAPFLALEWGGRMLRGEDRRLTYRADAATAPIVVELGNLRDITLGRRLFIEALAIMPLAAVLAVLVPSLRPVTTALGFLALLVTLLWRRYFLVVRWLNGGSMRWPLGTALVGSRKARRIDEAWSSAAAALAARGATVRDRIWLHDPRA
jgi:hypothetical protein